MQSKAIYRKHATAYKAANYPEHRAKRMLAYTAHLNKAIVAAMANRNKVVAPMVEEPQVAPLADSVEGESMKETFFHTVIEKRALKAQLDHTLDIQNEIIFTDAPEAIEAVCHDIKRINSELAACEKQLQSMRSQVTRDVLKEWRTEFRQRFEVVK